MGLNRERRRKYFWVGLFIALVFGIAAFMRPLAEKTITQAIEVRYSIEDPAFRQSISHLLGPQLTDGNRVKELVNGDQIFPEMLAAIRSAQQSITFENFIWRSGKLSTQFVDALSERARAGVKVCSIVDGVGSTKLDERDKRQLAEAGVELIRFNRPRWHRLFRVNHRTHRKLLVVDGKIGFTGGICIADEWMGNAEAPPHWRDTHFKIEGPAVAELQGVFTDHWTQKTSRVLHGPDFFPELKPAGNAVVQCFKSGPRDGAEAARLLYLYSIAAAKKTIRISQSYFVPDALALQELLAARARGVKVEVITPGVIDANIVRRASRSTWGKLLEAGVEFYEYQPALYHCKIMIIDDAWVTAGSVNFDDRSFRINDEANMNVLDKEFAAAQIRLFELDKQKSKIFSMANYKSRSWRIKLAESAAGLFHSQL